MPKYAPASKDVSIEMEYRSPIPSSRELKNYESVCPGAGKAIIENFLSESDHRREMERRDQNMHGHIADRTTRQYFYGLCFGFFAVIAFLAVGIWFMLEGYPTQGASIICSVVVGLGACFIYGSRGTKSK